MLYQDKYKLVVGSILEKYDPSYIELTIASNKKFKSTISKSELSKILDELEYKEKVIKVRRRSPHQKIIIKDWKIDKIKDITLSLDAYLGGISDTTGELVRLATNQAAKGNYDEVDKIKNTIN